MNLNEWSVLGVHRIFLITVALALLTASPASAITPPPIDPGALPPDVAGPDQPTEQRVLCASPTTLPGSGFHDPPWSNTYLGVADAHKFATGAGVTVAVIDTGVDASPRVPAEPGGDFVDQAGNGLSDCDAHGTLTASIIAGRPRPPTGSSASRPTLDCSRYVRRLRPSNRSAHKPTRMTPTPPRPPVPSAVLPAPWCTPPTSAWV